MSETMLRANERELERRVRDVHHRQQPPAVTRAPAKEPVLLRLTTVRDAEAMQRLSALECVPAPNSRCVVAEIDGTIVAALPLQGGKVIADPFRATAHLVPLLELRAKQLAAPAKSPRRSGIRGLVRALGRT